MTDFLGCEIGLEHVIKQLSMVDHHMILNILLDMFSIKYVAITL